MFFVLSKILSFLLSPHIWIVGLLIFSLLTKNGRRKRRSLLASVLLLFLFSNAFLFNECRRLWEKPYGPSKHSSADVYDGGIVLGGMAVYDKKHERLEFNTGIDRLWQAIDLYKSKRIRKLILVGGPGSLTNNDISESVMLREFLLRIGIPSEDMIIEPDSRNTRENAVNTAKLLSREVKTSRFLLFTSALHMRRAEACFVKAGLAVTPYATNLAPSERKYYPDHLLLPSASALVSWEMIIREIVGYGIYKVLGYA